MYKVDLLNGQGIPVRCRPVMLAVLVITMIVPLAIGTRMMGVYLENQTTIEVQNAAIIKYQSAIDELADAVEYQNWFQAEKEHISNCLSEMDSFLKNHMQWSVILETLSRNMPAEMVMTRLAVKKQNQRRTTTNPDNPEQSIEVMAPVKTLSMDICGGYDGNFDPAVKKFKDRLTRTPAIGPELSNILVSRHHDRLEKNEVVSYGIDCVFRPRF